MIEKNVGKYSCFTFTHEISPGLRGASGPFKNYRSIYNYIQPVIAVVRPWRQGNSINVWNWCLEGQRIIRYIDSVSTFFVFHGLVIRTPRLVIGRIVNNDSRHFHVRDVGEHVFGVVFPNGVLLMNTKDSLNEFASLFFLSLFLFITFFMVWVLENLCIFVI